MPEDASLDGFDSDETADAESTDSASADTSQTTETSPNPAVSTFDWSPKGGECADCGESAERRWRADGQRGGELVCADCKDW